MTSTELLDDLEAGELSVEFEGQEPEAVLEWAIEQFRERLSISTAFQEGDVALIDMAYRIDPKVNGGQPVRRDLQWWYAPRNLVYERNRI